MEVGLRGDLFFAFVIGKWIYCIARVAYDCNVCNNGEMVIEVISREA